MNILTLNAGSSSLKFRLFALEAGDEPGETVLAEGEVERVGTPDATLQMTRSGKPQEARKLAAGTLAAAAEPIVTTLGALETGQGGKIDAVGCRVVHGGTRFTQATLVTPDVTKAIRELGELAPLHNPAECDVIETAQRLLPETPVVAVFDTAFHRTLPPVAFRYALPAALSEQDGLRRYGFHGISYRYVSGKLLACLGREAPGSRLILFHLGSGASVCALRDGQSVDTSMGLTPLEGLVMGTRSGDIDPGLVLHLIHAKQMPVAEVEDLLNHRSGLLGLSGRSNDARDLEAAASAGDSNALLALEIFAYRARKYLGAYAAALGGVDAVAFTGGIGEHMPVMRDRICRGLEFLGLTLDADRNRAATGKTPACISAADARIAVWAIPTDEERQIARETFAVLHPH